jgi:hypothetical protein
MFIGMYKTFLIFFFLIYPSLLIFEFPFPKRES